MKTRKTAIALGLLALLVLGMLPTAAFAAELPFEDVDPRAWYAPAVDYAYSNHLMEGITDTDFGPEVAVNRAMVVTVLWRKEGSPAVSDLLSATLYYVDLYMMDAYWYHTPAAWALSQGIAKGYNLPFADIPTGFAYRFEPDKAITREELATMLYRYAQLRQADTTGREDLSRFADGDAVSPWAKEAMQWCAAQGILEGAEKNGARYLDPQGVTTRSQFAAILMRYSEKNG